MFEEYHDWHQTLLSGSCVLKIFLHKNSCPYLYELKIFLQQRFETKDTIHLFVNFTDKILSIVYLNSRLLLILIVFNLLY